MNKNILYYYIFCPKNNFVVILIKMKFLYSPEIKYFMILLTGILYQI